jgi:TetR/AcrR family transcriptional regulator, transcriptional repressor for nem operon
MDPVTTRGRQTRERIVEAAARLMYRDGVAATSVDHVLADAGAGKGQFYHYFGSKDDLVDAVLEFHAAGGESEQAAIFAEVPGWEGVRAWLDAVVAGQARSRDAKGCPIGSMAAELAERDPTMRDRLAAALERKRIVLRDRLEQLRQTGDLSPGADPEALATFTMAVLQGALLFARTFGRQDDLERTVDEAWRHLTSFQR